MRISGSRRSLGLALAAAMVCGALAGCGAGARTGATVAGASSDDPPSLYTAASVIGNRGNGVLRVPEAVAVAPDGSLYVGDQFSHIVQRFSAGGVFLGQFGSAGTGAGQFGTIAALATTPEGDVYVLDSSDVRIQEFDANDNVVRAWGQHGHSVGSFEFGPGGGPDIPPGGGIAVRGGHVYVSDTQNGRVQRFQLDGSHPQIFGHVHFDRPRGIAVTAAGVYVADDGDGRVVELSRTGRFLRAYGPRSGPHRLTDPYGVTAANGRIYVVDDNGGRVVELTSRLRWAGQLTGRGNGRLSSFLRGVAADAAGNVYVTDTGANRIAEFSPSGAEVATFGVSGNGGGQVTRPLAVAAARGGSLVVIGTYGSRSPIYVFGPTMKLEHVWERGGGKVIGRHWFAPTAVAVAPDGSVWVTDQRNNVVRHLSGAGRFRGAIGSPGGGRRPGLFEQPRGVAIGPHGYIYVADTGNNRIQRFTPSGRPAGAWNGRGRVVAPLAVAVSASGHMYVADSDGRVIELNPGGRAVRVWGPFGHPDGIAVDSRGTVFVADGGRNEIYVFSSPSGKLRGTIGAAAGLSRPEGLAIDCAGDLLVTDSLNNRIQIFHGAAAPGVC